MQNVLEQISHGMKVIDSRQKEIGTVEYVKMVDEDAETGEPLAADVDELDERPHSLLADFAEAFSSDELPDVVRDRLMHDGFVRMDAEGLFNADRYVMPDQIQSVAGDRVILKVTKDQLIKRH